MKIIDAYNAYRDDQLVTRNRSVSTMSQVKYHRASAVEFFGNVDIESLTVEDATAYIRWLFDSGRCGNTVRNYSTTFKRVLRNCRLRGLDVIDSEIVPVARREEVVMPYATPAEVRRMIEKSPTLRTKLVISLLFSSGLRVSELCNLKKADIVGDHFTVKGKGKRVRLCFIDQRTWGFMQDYLAMRDDTNPYLIISNRFKTKVTPGTIQDIVKNARHYAGITKHITPHSFRHGFATDLLENGAAIQDVSEMLGHASVQTTMIYRHVSNRGLYQKYRENHTV